jgi:catechol 2,3-dioxygenase-like lactoylglutathione lyase family enzyme
MKRFHVHVSVKDLQESVRFYSRLFGAPPAVEKPDYAKWMLEDPRVNFAISQRGRAAGINHLGFQVDSDAELKALRRQVADAEISALDQRNAACCYAKSDKYWIEDPQGVAWETFHTLDAIPIFGEEAGRAGDDRACCVPARNEKAGAACCG